MENYREKLKEQNLFIAILASILAVFCFVFAASEAGLLPSIAPSAGDIRWQSAWRGFCCGAAFGIFAMMIIALIRNIRALKNEAALKKLYIKEHDERTIQIWTAARASGMQVTLLAGLVAVVVSGYFSITVSLTLMVTVFAASLICLGFKLYYSRKF